MWTSYDLFHNFGKCLGKQSIPVDQLTSLSTNITWHLRDPEDTANSILKIRSNCIFLFCFLAYNGTCKRGHTHHRMCIQRMSKVPNPHAKSSMLSIYTELTVFIPLKSSKSLMLFLRYFLLWRKSGTKAATGHLASYYP